MNSEPGLFKSNAVASAVCDQWGNRRDKSEKEKGAVGPGPHLPGWTWLERPLFHPRGEMLFS